MGVAADGTPLLGAYLDLNAVIEQLHLFNQKRVDEMANEVGEDAIWTSLLGKRALPGVLLPTVVAIGLTTKAGPTLSLVGFMQIVRMEFSKLVLPTAFDEAALIMLEGLNRGFRSAKD